MNDAWQTGIVAAAVPIGFYLLNWYHKRRALKTPARAKTLPAEFRASIGSTRWCMVGIGVSIALALALVLSSLPGKYFVAVFPLMYCLLCVGLLFSYSRVLLQIDEGWVTFRGRFRVPRERIRSVFVMSGYIVIDIGERKRLTIPLWIEDPAGVLHLLRDTSKRQRARQGTSAKAPPSNLSQGTVGQHP